jgi:hypothetical protein
MEQKTAKPKAAATLECVTCRRSHGRVTKGVVFLLNWRQDVS